MQADPALGEVRQFIEKRQLDSTPTRARLDMSISLQHAPLTLIPDSFHGIPAKESSYGTSFLSSRYLFDFARSGFARNARWSGRSPERPCPGDYVACRGRRPGSV